MQKAALMCAIGALGLSVIGATGERSAPVDLDDAREVRAMSDVRQLMMLVSMYEMDRGELPRTTGARTWHEVLVIEGYLVREVLDDGWWRDPWGNAYVYADEEDPWRVRSAACQTASVVSLGVDGVRSGDDVGLE